MSIGPERIWIGGVEYVRADEASQLTGGVGERERLRLCGYCQTWNAKPCGNQCCLRPNDPTWDEHLEALSNHPGGGE